jgi:hypothetical protein
MIFYYKMDRAFKNVNLDINRKGNYAFNVLIINFIIIKIATISVQIEHLQIKNSA